MKKKCVPYGSDVSAGTFECADCGKRIQMASRPLYHHVQILTNNLITKSVG